MHEVQFGATRLQLVHGDITTQTVDAIVNAANSALLGGGGVDGAIHSAGGPAILEECRAIRDAHGYCPTGEAVITTGGTLPARHVIHTVGPVWDGGNSDEDELLGLAWTNSLELAGEHGLRTVAFPSISTGAYGFPVERAAEVALAAVAAHCSANPGTFDEVRVVLHSEADLAAYGAALSRVAG